MPYFCTCFYNRIFGRLYEGAKTKYNNAKSKNLFTKFSKAILYMQDKYKLKYLQ